MIGGIRAPRPCSLAPLPGPGEGAGGGRVPPRPAGPGAPHQPGNSPSGARAARHLGRSRLGSAATHSSFLSRSASSSRPGPRARGSGTLPRAAARIRVRSPRTQEGTALAPDAARPGVGRPQGVRAVRTHRRSAPAPAPYPRSSALLRPLPAPPSPPRLAPDRRILGRWVRRTHPLHPAGAPLPAAGPPAV